MFKSLQAVAKLFWREGLTTHHSQLWKQNAQYYKQKPSKSTGCNFRILVMKCIVYSEYRVTEENETAVHVHSVEEKQLKFTRNPTEVTTKVMSYLSLPMEEAHTGHPTGRGAASFTKPKLQRWHN